MARRSGADVRSSVFIGGAGAAVALKAGSRMGGVSWPRWQYVGNLLRGQRIGTYDELASAIRGNGVGEAAH